VEPYKTRELIPESNIIDNCYHNSWWFNNIFFVESL